VTSNVGQNYPYTSESDGERVAHVASLIADRPDLADKLKAETTPLDANDRWWVYKCPSKGCAGLLHAAAMPRRSTPSTSSATGPAPRPSSARPDALSGPVPHEAGSGPNLRAARRQLLLDTAGIAVSAVGFGFVFGLAARNAGYSVVEAGAMSVIGFAGAAQFAAVGYVSAGLPWAPIVVLTLFLNARHLLYSASLAPSLRSVPFLQRAAMAHVLTDEAFALAATHFRRLGRVDVPGTGSGRSSACSSHGTWRRSRACCWAA